MEPIPSRFRAQGQYRGFNPTVLSSFNALFGGRSSTGLIDDLTVLAYFPPQEIMHCCRAAELISPHFVV
jgi:hypothetical protein